MKSTTPRSLRRLALGALTGLALAAAPSAALAVAPWGLETTLTNADSPSGTLRVYSTVPSPKGDIVYLGAYSQTKVFKLDAKTNAITGTIELPTGRTVNLLAIDPQGRYLYVWTRSWSDPTIQTSVLKVDLQTDTVAGTVAIVPRRGSIHIRNMAVSPDGSTLYYSGQGNYAGMGKTDIATNTNTDIPVVGIPGIQPGKINLSPDGTRAYLTYYNQNGAFPQTGVLSIDLANPSSQTDWVISNTVDWDASSSALSPDGSVLYVWNEGLSDLYAMSTTTGAILRTINVGAGCGSGNCGWGLNTLFGISPTGKYAVAINPNEPGSTRSWMIDLTTDAVTPLTSAEGFAGGPGYSPEFVAFGSPTACNSKVYIESWGNGSNTPVFDIGRAVAGPCAPTGVVATPGVEKIDVSFTAPDNGGSPITGYEYSLDGGATWKSTGSSDTRFSITGLKGGTAYTVTVRAINAAAPGAVSAQATATPTAPAQNQQTPSEASPAITMPAASVTRGATLTTAVNPSVAGTVRVTATLRGRTVCTATRKATRAGRMMVTCTLRPAAQAAIRKKAVTLRVTTRLTDAAGKTATASRNVRVARYVVRVPVTG